MSCLTSGTFLVCTYPLSTFDTAKHRPTSRPQAKSLLNVNDGSVNNTRCGFRHSGSHTLDHGNPGSAHLFG